MGVDQNKDIWGSYNRRSTANQSRSQRCQSRESSLVCSTILRRGSSKHCYILQYLEPWREPRPTQAGLTIAEQSRINRGSIMSFWILLDPFGKNRGVGLVYHLPSFTCCQRGKQTPLLINQPMGKGHLCRGFHQHFLKIELIWVVIDFEFCCSDSSLPLAIAKYHMIIMPYMILISPLTIADSGTNVLSITNQSRINRDAGFYNRGCSNTHALS